MLFAPGHGSFGGSPVQQATIYSRLSRTDGLGRGHEGSDPDLRPSVGMTPGTPRPHPIASSTKRAWIMN
jgi:hypothetical protein